MTGLGDSMIRRHTSQIGTRMYMAPEIMKDGNYSLPVDIYSLGKNVDYLFFFISFNTFLDMLDIRLNFSSLYPISTSKTSLSWLLNKGIILFELFTVFTSNMDRGIQIRDAKAGKVLLQQYTGIDWLLTCLV